MIYVIMCILWAVGAIIAGVIAYSNEYKPFEIIAIALAWPIHFVTRFLIGLYTSLVKL